MINGIEIIKSGSLPEDEVHKASCLYCGTEVRFKRSAASHESGGRNDSYLKIKCPLPGCKHYIYKDINHGR